MTLKSLLLAILFFSPAETTGKSRLKLRFNSVKSKLKKYNVTLDPLLHGSPDFLQDPTHNKTEKQRFIEVTTTIINKRLQLNVTFCKLIATAQQAACDMPIELQLARNELINQNTSAQNKTTYHLGTYVYGKNTLNVIRLCPPDLCNEKQLAYALDHELEHAMIATNNTAVCNPQDARRKTARFADRTLSFAEQITAPYEAATKAAFRKTIGAGRKRLTELKQMYIAFLNHTADAPKDSATIAFIHCLEAEANKNKVDYCGRTPLMRILNGLENVISLDHNEFLSPDRRVYEDDASLSLADDYPELNHYLFRERNEWIEQRIPKFKACLDEREPDRLSKLICKR